MALKSYHKETLNGNNLFVLYEYRWLEITAGNALSW